MEKNTMSTRIIIMVILLIIAIISIFVVSPLVSSPAFHTNTIETLDEKKITVMELTAATTGIATALACVPGDATTPLANQMLDLSTYLLIIIGVIFLEKILLTLTGYMTFTFLIPIACLLYAIYLFVKKENCKTLAIKLAVFGIVIFMVVPISVKVSNLIEDTYQTSINQTIEDAKNSESAIEENAEEETEESEGWNGLTSKLKDGISSIGNTASEWIEKGEKMLSNFIDAIAILLITSCVIPIVVLLAFLWIIKIIFSVNIPIPNIKTIRKSDSITREQLSDSEKI